MICELPQQSNTKMVDWSAKNETHELSFLPIDDLGYRPQIISRRGGSDISHFAFKRPADSSTPSWNISRYLPTTTRGLTKNSKNFQASLTQVRQYIVSDPLEYWHLTPIFWSGHIMLLTYRFMPYSKPNSSPCFGLRTKNRQRITLTNRRAGWKQSKEPIRRRNTCMRSKGVKRGKILASNWSSRFVFISERGAYATGRLEHSGR